MTPDTSMEAMGPEALEALALTSKSLGFDVPPSPLASLPTFRPRSVKLTQEQARAQVAATLSQTKEDQTAKLQAEIEQLKALILQALSPQRPQGESWAAIQSQPPLSPQETSQEKTSVVAPPVVPAVTESVAPSAPLISPQPNKVVESLREYVSRKQPWKGFRESVWRSGCYRTDRWPKEMLAGVEVIFNDLIADEQFVAAITAAIQDIAPGAPNEKMFHYVSGAAGWLAWVTYTLQTYGGKQ